ncbi:intracellular multiplication protein IcmP [Piscirickettsia salmonis]|uniref:type IVB secretion system coupling complex protein DotM/IcmP n=1 Tax=Piscirickettsia salmonis TaxID=1238 RepID=UPI0012B88B49|nr:type IVB secretion system coupling complex protein DotM/IcmP [Piscirickettsia salmonis]QGP49270.1 intracellular multiplication protein IcmP [Piscirickettsia salmonis]QGP55974.1 intracellular multiplication protein IcmP [Piscirickettsia salmonis]QGP58157.1 intracellular multiplication protein IcmP [Piscirickettsia salmonis]QGP65545.1 intracellular multiplication protein IcmP [Piscirickettsia salmonis]
MQNNDQGGVPHIIYYIAAIAIGSCAIFIYFHDEIVGFILILKMFEVRLINLVTGQLQDVIDWSSHTPIQAVTANDLYVLSNKVGLFFCWFNIFITVILTLLLWKYHPGNKLATKHSMSTLLANMKDSFCETRPIIGKSLSKESINKGSWKMALTPLEFMKANNLLDDNKKVNEGLAKEIFINQLGKAWINKDELTEIEKATFGILAAFSCYKRQEAEKAANEISMSSQNKSLNLTLALGLFSKFSTADSVEKVIASHQYVYTVFSSLLEEARQSGIVSTALFLWLKSQDRSLWYCLNNVGRQAVFIEGAAIRSHWLAEKALGNPIEVPMIDKAISGLNDVFKTVEID